MLSEDEKCPNRPVTARCRVRRPVDSTQQFLLLWECDDTETIERVILCNDNPALELNCNFGKLYDIRSSCIYNETIIESEATFNTTSMCDVILYCSDGAENAGVSVSIKGEFSYTQYVYRWTSYSNTLNPHVYCPMPGKISAF